MEQALVNDEDKPYGVPGNWVWVKLGSACVINPPKVNSKSLPEDLKVSFVPMSAVSEISGSVTVSETRNLSEVKNGYTNFADNDVLFAKITPCMENGKSTIVTNLTNGVGYGSTEFYVFRVNKCIINKFVYYLVRAKWFREKAKMNMSGSVGQQRVPKFYLESYNCPLPPLPEQQRIVTLIESLFEKLDRAKELAQNALDSFGNRKSAILHKAFTGELTREWREEHREADASDAIEEIYNYRLSTAKKTEEKDKIETIFKYQESNSNNNLPEYWRYTSLEKLCKAFQYGTSKKSETSGEVVVIRMGNLQSGKIDWSKLAYTSDEQDINKYLLKKGDVLFNRTNSPDLVGKTSIYEGEMPAIFAGYLIRIKNYECLDSHYLNYAMNTSFAKEYCMIVKSDGVNQSNINAQKLAKLEIPLCSIKEQQEIVRILDHLLENEQKAKDLCNVIDKIDHIKKSILAKAFRGELGTNHPEEESALELLKEVLQEKAK